jgi:hypothetical protein
MMILLLAFLGLMMEIIGIVMFLIAVNSKYGKGRIYDSIMMIFFFGGAFLCIFMTILGYMIFFFVY